MKTLDKHIGTIYTIVALATLLITSAGAQTINWASLGPNHRHIINAGFNFEYGMVYNAGYSYQVKNKLAPTIVGIEYSRPAGNKAFDDYKTKMGGQVRWINYRNIQFSTRIQGVFRRYENNFARLLNFGSDLSATAGYYRTHWFVAAEFGFDKAIVTHFKHSNTYRDQYAGVVDGWYEPATGGNFYYGLQGGFSLGRHDITLKAGKMISQDFKTTPVFPYYAQAGYNIKF